MCPLRTGVGSMENGSRNSTTRWGLRGLQAAVVLVPGCCQRHLTSAQCPGTILPWWPQGADGLCPEAWGEGPEQEIWHRSVPTGHGNPDCQATLPQIPPTLTQKQPGRGGDLRKIKGLGFSKSSPQASSMGIMWECVRHADSQAPPRSHWIPSSGGGARQSVFLQALQKMLVHPKVWKALLSGFPYREEVLLKEKTEEAGDVSLSTANCEAKSFLL